MRLIDADKLKEELSYKSPAPDFGIDGVILGVIDEQPTASPWHRVEEPPKEEGKYLVYDGRGNYHVAWWGQRSGWCYDPKFFRYWMPIEPPKEDA